jgi:methionyl aminopeptidase
MSIESEADLLGLRRAGRVTRLALQAMRRAIRPGVSTSEIDAAGTAVLRAHGARSAPKIQYGFPRWTLVSVNDEAVHGIPGRRRLEPGDLVKLDVTAELNGYIADAAITVSVAPGRHEARRVAACARSAFRSALRAARAGNRTRDVGRAVEAEAARWGYRVLRELTGHGVGRRIHEPPTVPNFDDPGCSDLLSEGMVITIEPLISAGSRFVKEDRDGWTVRTVDGALCAHHEHTLVITADRPLLLTA